MTIVRFPVEAARSHTKRARLVSYLRELADFIERDELETEPDAALVVLTGAEDHEVVCCGYGDDDNALDEAAMVAGSVTRGSFVTMGGNRRKRGDYRPKRMERPNIVDGVFPRKSDLEAPDHG
ncbi:hypothetical protein [Methylobacterium sp. CM6247]